MKYILSHTSDPYFNLAAEEYLLKNHSEDIYFQYVNDDAVVIGKHQNTLAEIDLEYLLKNNILLARRISGGGAVFHDKGNMNYSFLTTEKPGDYIKFDTYTSPVINALNKLDVNAVMGKRNEILSHGKKISGTASHVYKNRVLHHGTLLFNADLEKLSSCLYVNPGRFNDKAVKSVRSEVININRILHNRMDANAFYDFIFQFIFENFRSGELMKLSEYQIKQIEKLRDEKFVTWDWNYGYSPKYELTREVQLPGGMVSIHIFVNKGIIQEVTISGASDHNLDIIKPLLEGSAHNKDIIIQKLSGMIDNKGFMRQIISALF